MDCSIGWLVGIALEYSIFVCTLRGPPKRFAGKEHERVAKSEMCGTELHLSLRKEHYERALVGALIFVEFIFVAKAPLYFTLSWALLSGRLKSLFTML